jgi:ATP-dependent Lhr-like helicase
VEDAAKASGGLRPPLAEAEVRWSEPTNLEQVQRSTLALLRREVLTCSAPQFADFALRWQQAHPETRRSGSEGLPAVLERLEGLALPVDLWERVILPARIFGYQSRWLDEQVSSGAWTWACEGEGDATADLAFWKREHLPELPRPLPEGLDQNAESILERLQSRGASFVVDLAQDAGLAPSAVRAGLWELGRHRLATNDQFDVVRRGEKWGSDGAERLSTDDVRSRRPGLATFRSSAAAPRRRSLSASEGRWSLIPWGQPESEAHAVFRALLLLQRYGIVARELALLDPSMLPWRVLYEVLSRMELAGSVRRGYFVEGLSGAQFALPEAAQMLQDCGLPSTALAPVVLLHSLDPANLYGAGAPFDIPLLDGGTRPFVRRAGNWLVLKAGRPVLLIEQQGKRLTALPSASQDDVSAAVARLPDILTADHGLAARRKLSVAEWNGQPVTATAGKPLLEAAGFVRDYQELTLYAAWR